MKKLILASFALLALAACETSTSSNGSASKGGSVNGFTCNVSSTENSVTIHETYAGQTYTQTQTVYMDNYGEYYSVFTTDITFNDPAEAAEECEDEQDEARSWRDGSYQVECTANSVHVWQRDDSDYRDMERMAVKFQSMCDDGYQRAQNGTLGD